MARNEIDKRKSGGTQVAEPVADEAQPESLDKVRDILFGGQMRAVETRLQGLEERLRREHEALGADFARQVESLDAFIRSETQALGERLAAERTKRGEEIKALAAEIKETIRALERRHVKLEEAANLADASLRDQLLLQSKAAAGASPASGIPWPPTPPPFSPRSGWIRRRSSSTGSAISRSNHNWCWPGRERH